MKTMLTSRRERYLARFGVFLITVALIAGTIGCGIPAEEEEEEEEQAVQTWYDLYDIRNNLSGTYFLDSDLDSTTPGYQELASETANTGKGWEPIGASGLPFTGTFDGAGHSITGLYISRPDEDDVGLFGYVEEGAIKNVGLVAADVTGGNQTGALVGYNWGGTVESDPTRPYSTYSTGSVTGDDKVGGLVGYNWGGIVSLSQSSAEIAHVSGETWRAGGLVGSNWGDVLLCIYSGSVTGDHEVGGLVGLNGDLLPGGIGGRVISCYGEYTVTGNWFVGGAAGVNLGSLDNISLNFSVNGRPVSGGSFMALNTDTTVDGHSSDTTPQGSYVGGLVGLNKGSVNNCVTVGSVTGYQYVGGLVGYNDPDGAIGSSFAATGVEGSLDFGGLIGYNDATGTVANSFWDRETSDTNTGVGTGDAAGITSKSSQEMKDINTYIQAGWDICAVASAESNTTCTWNIVPGQTYPFLSGKQRIQHNLIISSTEGGKVSSPGEGVFACDEGTAVNLVAQPDEGYHFVNWTGEVNTMADVSAAQTTISMKDDYSITANFEEEEGPDLVPVGTDYCGFYGFPDRFFEESSLTRDQVVKVVSAQYLSLKKMHNGISPYEFCRVEYEPEAYGVTSPTGFKLGDYAFPSLNSGHHRWEVMAHEQGHNFFGGTSWFYYTMAAPYSFLQESLAVLSAFYTYHDILENAVAYGIDDDSIDSLVFDFTNGRAYQESMYNKYVSEGSSFNLGNSSDILTSQALDFKMITYGEQYGWHNFEDLTRAFENELDTQFSFLDDSASAIEQSTYIVAALNVAFQRDFTQEFIELEFPIDSSLLQEFTTVLEQHIY